MANDLHLLYLSIDTRSAFFSDTARRDRDVQYEYQLKGMPPLASSPLKQKFISRLLNKFCLAPSLGW